jgi:dimethylglycine dehydrogenase
MLNEAGRLMGDLSLTRLEDDRWWLTGSYYLQDWHLRWFERSLPDDVELRNITEERMGFSISGPASREILRRCTTEDISNDAFGFLHVRSFEVGSIPADVGRISLTGELGYEIVVSTERHRELLDVLQDAGAGSGLRLIGDRAIDSLRLEKAYGIWSAEFRQDITPAMAGLDRFVAFDKGDFTGREAALAEGERGGPARSLVLLAVDATDADASTDEGIWLGDRLVGLVTSGAYGHHVGMSLALAYLDREVIDRGEEVTIFIVGEPRTARVLPHPPYDPAGARLRDLA